MQVCNVYSGTYYVANLPVSLVEIFNKLEVAHYPQQRFEESFMCRCGENLQKKSTGSPILICASTHFLQQDDFLKSSLKPL